MAYILSDINLICLEKRSIDIHYKVSLNVSLEDINYALDKEIDTFVQST